MANEDRTAVDFVDKRIVQGQKTNPVATPANYASVNAMRTRLNAISSGYYSTASLNNGATNLDRMTKNDMQYALRLNDDAAGI